MVISRSIYIKLPRLSVCVSVFRISKKNMQSKMEKIPDNFDP